MGLLGVMFMFLNSLVISMLSSSSIVILVGSATMDQRESELFSMNPTDWPCGGRTHLMTIGPLGVRLNWASVVAGPDS